MLLADGILKVFYTMFIVQMFYAVSIVALVNVMPADMLQPSQLFQSNLFDFESASQQVQNAINDQTDIPLVEVGALVFYSGNIVIDLLVNFFAGIPAMVTMFLNGLMVIFSIDTNLMYYFQAFLTIAWNTYYFISLISFVTNMRSGGNIV